MKRTATLVAGLLLVTGTVFAAGNLDFAGSTIKVKSTLLTTAGADLNDDSNGDTDYNLHLKYTLDDKTSATFGYTTDDNSDTYDNSLNVKVKRTEGTVEAQISAELNLGTNELTGTKQNVFKENQDTSDTYIKWNRTKDMSLAFYPFNMGMNNGSMFDEGDTFTQIPGVVATFGNAYVGAGSDAANGTTENVVAVKAGYTLTAGAATVKAKYSGAFFDEDKLTAGAGQLNSANGGRIGVITHDVNVNLNYKLSKALTIDAEAGYNVLEENTYTLSGDKVDSGFGATAKASYAMSSVLTPYAQVKYTTDGYVAYGDMFDLNKVGTKTGGLLELIAGADYALAKNLTLNGEATLKSAGEKIYSDNDAVAAQEKTAFALSGYVKYTF